MGIAALKIEGRYKEPDYVALTTRAYRRAVDEAWAGVPASSRDAEKLQLEQVYSRGLGPWFLTGTDHQAVVAGRAPRHRGVLMGRITAVGAESLTILPGAAALKPGDGVVVDSADWRSPEEPEEGGRVYQAEPRPGGRMEVRFANRAVDFSRVRPGDLLWRTHDPEIDKAVRPYTEAPVPLRRQPLRVRVTAREGAPLEAEWSVAEFSVVTRSEAPLGAAQQRAMTQELVRDQLGRLGNTPYELGEVEVRIEGCPFAPVSLLNQLRRQAVEQLQALQAQPRPRAILEPLAVVEDALAAIAPATGVSGEPQIHLLVRTPEQLEAALALAPASITLDYLDLYGLRPSVERVKAAGIPVRVASPRILKPGEDRISDMLLRFECSILVRSAGLLETLAGTPTIADFSLNAANAVTADTLLALGPERITPTHDLNAEQVAALARAVGGERIEAIAYQHLPVFHTEHCVFCRFLSQGASYRDCGRPCEKHRVTLRDVSGREHPVMADVGCRNTVFGAEAQEAGPHLHAWREAGIRHFRLEFVHESGEQVERVTRLFEQALAGRMGGKQLSQELRRLAPGGTTEGSLFVPAGYLTLPVLQ